MDDPVAHVPADLEDLLPAFRENRAREPRELRDALAAQDFQRLQDVAERMYSLGNPYGFRQITTFGRQLREACEAKDPKAIATIVGQYETYLTRVSVSLVSPREERAAWPRPQQQQAASEEWWR